MNLSEHMELQCKKAGKTTIATHTPRGGTLIYVSSEELDPVTACLHAALEIAGRRQLEGKDVASRFEIKASKFVVNPQHAYAWTVWDDNGKAKQSGFASSEEEARIEVKKALGYDE